MRYHVTGTNHANGARMSLDLEAGSKAAAERKAQNAGMDVQHVQPMKDDEPHAHSTHRGEDDGSGSGLWIKAAVIVIVMIVAAYFAWPMIRRIFGH